MQHDLSEYRQVMGNSGVLLLRRDMGTDIEYTALTLWSSVEAIKAFAGDDYERARYYPGDGKIFKFLNPKAEHFEVVCAEFPEAKFQIGAPPP